VSVAVPSTRVVGATVLVATMATLLLGFAHKSLCLVDGSSGDERFRSACYSDIVPLYRDRGFADRRLPYLDAPNEYPVGTALLQWVAALPVDREGEYLVSNAVILAALGVATSLLLASAVGRRALLFALAPSLALYAFLNWDLLPVALATAAVIAFVRRRDAAAGVLVGLGVAAKLYPVLLLVPFAAERRREGDREGAVRVAAWAAAAWLVVDLPFMVLSFDRWSEVFRFSGARDVHWSTLWYVGCRAVTGELVCGHVDLVNALSLVAFAIGAVWVWRAAVTARPDVPRWTLGFPLLIVFLLTSKVYSPQYSLWLVPWFALVLPDLRLFLAFEASDLAVFVTEFAWLERFLDGGGLPLWPLEVATVARAAVLVAILVRLARRPPEPALVGAAAPVG
jgi:uncharacterized membrane protein